MPEVELSAPQDDFVYLEKKFKAYVAGFGAGKTWAGCCDMSRHFCDFPKVPQGYFAPSYPLIRDIFYPTIEECAYQWGFRVEVRQANKEVHFFRGRRYYGTTICRSMDNPSSIIGFKIGKALVDELDVLDSVKAEHAWNKIIARLRWKQDGVLNGVSVTTTPEGFKFTYNRFFKDPKPMYGMVRASTYSNAHNLPDDYISSLIETYPPHLINAYLDGEFVNMTSGAVYPDFSRLLNHTDEEIEYGEPLHLGLDFNVHNCSVMTGVIRKRQPRFLDEMTGLRDTPAMIDAIKERYPLNHISVYPDASGKAAKSVNASLSDIQLLREAGFTVIVDSANPKVKDRVMAMNGVILNGLGERKLLVNTKKCPVLTECLEQQVYDKNGEPDKTEGKDHATDAAGYFIHKHFPIIKSSITRTVPLNIMGR